MTDSGLEPTSTELQNQKPLLIIASNRGPFAFTATRDGQFTATRGAGGLVTALGGLAEQHEVLWIAMALSRGDSRWAAAHGSEPQNVEGVLLRLLRPARKKQYEQYYNHISNPLLWFIQHQLWDTPRKPSITAETWQAWDSGYVAINRLFADAIVEVAKDSQRPVIVLPQDYHLYLLPRLLRMRLGRQVQIQPFIHIPWPGPDAWRVLPQQMRVAVLDSLLAADRIGFQTRKDAFNFVQTCRFYLNDAHSYGSRDSIVYQGRRVEAKAYPISIDVEKLEAMVEQDETRSYKMQLRRYIGDRKLILRVDRVEPSKNILRGLEAFRALLETHPEHKGRVQMMALLVPSRMEVDEYQDYLQEIMAMAGFINAEYSDGQWEPVRILLGNNYARALAAMRLHDVLLVNPITDGMNLVAKEGSLVNRKRRRPGAVGIRRGLFRTGRGRAERLTLRYAWHSGGAAPGADDAARRTGTAGGGAAQGGEIRRRERLVQPSGGGCAAGLEQPIEQRFDIRNTLGQ